MKQALHLPHNPRSDGVGRWRNLVMEGDSENRAPLGNRGQACVFTEGKGVGKVSSPFSHLPSPVYSFLVPSRGLSHS